MKQTRTHLSAKGLLTLTKNFFATISPLKPTAKRTANPISLSDCLMSGLAIFGMKFPSLLKFNEQCNQGGTTKRNLRTLYQVRQPPCDTHMRTRLDEVDPRAVQPIFKKVFAQVQRGKALEPYEYFDRHYLMPLDATGFFSSNSVHCENCCVKNNKKCHLKIIDELPEEEKLKKNTYYLVKTDEESDWLLIFIDKEINRFKIDLSSVEGLDELLQHKVSKKIAKADKQLILTVLEDYHTQAYGESLTYYHNMLCGAIAHPDKKIVLPLAPEPILKGDGATKNDCERNAAKRFINDFRREHPHLKVIAVQDSLASNYPHLSELKKANVRFIVGVKPGDHKALFEWVNSMTCAEYEHSTADGTTHRYRYLNHVPLNDSHPEFEVNFIEYWETNKQGKVQHFSWVTDIFITDAHCYDLMRGGRINWRIENNTFNTLKNQGYHFEHNYGHGYKHLSTIFGMLMLLAFFIDQVQELCCQRWRNARATYKSRTTFYDKVTSLFMDYIIHSWEDLYGAIANGYKEYDLVPDTS